MKIIDENEYLKKYPVINDIVTGLLEKYGINIDKYKFKKFYYWEERDCEIFDVYYLIKDSEEIEMFISTVDYRDRIEIENFEIYSTK